MNLSRSRFAFPILIPLLALLITAAILRLGIIYQRSITYDEAVILLETAGNPSPQWPEKINRASESKALFSGSPSFAKLYSDLALKDVQPPLYFWALSVWRNIFGSSLEIARLFSFGFSLFSICLFYYLLRLACYRHALFAASVYACSFHSVMFGAVTKSYAMATFFLFLAAIAAYLCFKYREYKARRIVFAFSMLVCASTAVAVQYLAIFCAAAIIGWFVLRYFKISVKLCAFVLIASAGLLLLALSLVPMQLGNQPGHYPNFPGLWLWIELVFLQNLEVIFGPRWLANEYAVLIYSAVALLLLSSCVALYRNWPIEQRVFWQLMIAMLTFPTLGLLICGSVFNKHLMDPRYLGFAEPSLALFLGHGICSITESKLSIRALMVASLFLLLCLSIPLVPGVEMFDRRTIANAIAKSSNPDKLVIIGAGLARGDIAAMLYELEPSTQFVALTRGSNINKFKKFVGPYKELWVVQSGDGGTADLEASLIEEIHATRNFVLCKKGFKSLQFVKFDYFDKSSCEDDYVNSSPHSPLFQDA